MCTVLDFVHPLPTNDTEAYLRFSQKSSLADMSNQWDVLHHVCDFNSLKKLIKVDSGPTGIFLIAWDPMGERPSQPSRRLSINFLVDEVVSTFWGVFPLC